MESALSFMPETQVCIVTKVFFFVFEPKMVSEIRIQAIVVNFLIPF